MDVVSTARGGTSRRIPRGGQPMPVLRYVTPAAPAALPAILVFAPPHRSAAPKGAPDTNPTVPATDVEVKYIDDSTMKLKVLDDRLELVTKYGHLQIPLSDVRRI